MKTVSVSPAINRPILLLIMTLPIILVIPILRAGAAPGDLDPAFGTGGIVTTGTGPSRPEDPGGVKIQPDGKIVVAATTLDAADEFGRDFLVARYNVDGSLDSTFGAGGLVITDVGGDHTNDTASSLVIQSDGRILVGGYKYNSMNANADWALVRYESDGSLDSTFGTGGLVITPLSTGTDTIGSLAIQPDGKIIAGGRVSTANDSWDFALVRYNADGSIDTNFGSSGVVSTDFNHLFDGVNSVVLQTDGKIVAIGVANSDLSRDFAVARYNPDGSLDSTFGTGGKIVLDLTGSNVSDGANAGAVQPDGKIIAAGTSTRVDGDFSLVRFNADGSLDTTFGNNGIVFTDLGPVDVISSVILQSDSKIVAAGNSINRFGLVRYNQDGSVDPGFGLAGIVTSPAGTGGPAALQADHKIVALGTFPSGADRDLRVVRYLNDAVAPSTTAPFDFDGDGKTDVSIFRPSPTALLDNAAPEGSSSQWWIFNSGTQSSLGITFGQSDDALVPADYTGDGKADVAFFRPSNSTWYVLRSDDLTFYAFPFGASGDTPAPGDFDGDGKADPAVYRPSSGTWFILRSSDSGVSAVPFGIAEDKPIVADYDGDGMDDVAVYRPSVNQFWLLRSTEGVLGVQFGAAGDRTAIGDWTGDGKADVAFYRPSTSEFYVIRSEDSSFFAFPWGATGDISAVGDYDGDGVTDAAVYRPAIGTWFINGSTSGFLSVPFGLSGDVPVPSVSSQQ